MPLDFIIHFNEARGFEDEALKLARRLFATYDEAIDSLLLIPLPPDDPEDFALRLNGRLLRSLTQSGQAPLVADARRALQEGRES